MNTLHILSCYWSDGTWCFDDASRGLLKEPFVFGADAILTRAAELLGISDAKENGFRLLFSDANFPHSFAFAERMEAEAGGHWYSVGGFRGWLCPAMLKYYPAPPDRIYFLLEASR